MVKRFYTSVKTGQTEAGYFVALDDRRLKTPAKRDLDLPTSIGNSPCRGMGCAGRRNFAGLHAVMRLVATALTCWRCAGCNGRQFCRYAVRHVALSRRSASETCEASDENWSPVLAWAQEGLIWLSLLPAAFCPSTSLRTMRRGSQKLLVVTCFVFRGWHMVRHCWARPY